MTAFTLAYLLSSPAFLNSRVAASTVLLVGLLHVLQLGGSDGVANCT